MSDPKDRPNIEERYSSATHATSLVVSEIKSGAADMLIAAGWSQSRLGAALLRLVSEWDGAEKPQPLNPRAMEILATAIARENGRVKSIAEDHKEAKQQAADWLLHEQKILMGKLKTLPEVREQLKLRAEKTGLDNPMEKAMAALHWWLDHVCYTCHGLRRELIHGTPVLSHRNCPACRGSGERPRPNGLETLALLSYIDDCVNAARVSMRKRLRQFPHHKETTT